MSPQPSLTGCEWEAELGAEPWIQGSPLEEVRQAVGQPAFSPSTDTLTDSACAHVYVQRVFFFFLRINKTNSLQSTEVLDRQ